MKRYFALKEQILFDPEIAVRTEPLITSNLEETSIRLPFDDLDKKTRPNVSTAIRPYDLTPNRNWSPYVFV